MITVNEKLKKHGDMRKNMIAVAGLAVLFLLLAFCLLSVKTVRLEGTLNAKENCVDIVFNPFQVGTPASLESDDEVLMEYAKTHDGEKVACDVKYYDDLFKRRIFKLQKVYYDTDGSYDYLSVY